jgi:outer membrane protein TolC
MVIKFSFLKYCLLYATIVGGIVGVSFADEQRAPIEIKKILSDDTNESDSNTTTVFVDTNITTTAKDDNKSVIFENKATLKAAIDAAIHSNYRIKQAKERVLQAKYSTREAFADFLPQVNLSATATQKGSKGYETQDYKQLQGDATLSYNLFSSGMHIATVQRSQITQKEQEERLKSILEEETLKLIDAYLSVVYGRLSIEVNQNNFDKLLQILEIVKIKKQFGAATAGDEGSIMASVSNAKTALINTESAYNNSKDYYEFLTGTKTELLSPYATDFGVKLKSFDEVYDEIRANNTDLSIIKTQIKGKQKEVFVSKAADMPKMDFTLTNMRKFRNDLIDSTQKGNNRDTTAELVLSYNLYTGGRAEAKTARLLSEVSGLVFNLEYMTKDTKWNSQKLFNSVHTNSRALESLNTEINASKRMADAYWEKFRLSSQDLVTLLQAQRQVNAAELEKLRSEKTRTVDYFNLLAKSGKLLEYFGF